MQRYKQKCAAIGNVEKHGHGRNPGNQQRRFHGTKMSCKFNGGPCSSGDCRLCCIIKHGFDISKLGQSSGNSGWYGPGHYSTSLPSTAFGYGSKNALLVVGVAVGVAETTKTQTSSPLPQGCHSRVVEKPTGVDELVVAEDDQMLPKYVILF